MINESCDAVTPSEIGVRPFRSREEAKQECQEEEEKEQQNTTSTAKRGGNRSELFTAYNRRGDGIKTTDARPG
jgi:hypothetical protein